MSKTIIAKVNDLRIHPSYVQIYSVDNHQREILKESILRTGGILEPIVITPANVIIHGVQRYLVYEELGWDEIPATIFDKADHAQVFYMISYNRHKDKSMLEKWNEISYLKTVYKKKQGERTDLQEGLSDFDKMSTRKKIALHCNIAEGNVYKIEKVAESNKELLNLISSGEMSLHQAYILATGKAVAKEPVVDLEDVGSPIEAIYQHKCPKCNHQFN